MKKNQIDEKRKGFDRNDIPTLADVARFAGVSVMSVWRMMNGEASVSERIRRKVVEAVETLHYAPNHQARALAGSRIIRIGVVHDQDPRFLSEFLLSLFHQSVVNNVSLVVQKSTDVNESIGADTSRMKVDGMILLPSLYAGDMAENAFFAPDRPAVVVGSALAGERIGAVHGDDREAAYKMTSHLIRLGHRRIGFISGPAGPMIRMRRQEG